MATNNIELALEATTNNEHPAGERKLWNKPRLQSLGGDSTMANSGTGIDAALESMS